MNRGRGTTRRDVKLRLQFARRCLTSASYACELSDSLAPKRAPRPCSGPNQIQQIIRLDPFFGYQAGMWTPVSGQAVLDVQLVGDYGLCATRTSSNQRLCQDYIGFRARILVDPRDLCLFSRNYDVHTASSCRLGAAQRRQYASHIVVNHRAHR